MVTAASFKLTGFPALLVILIILALIAIGIYTVIKKGKNKLKG